MPGDERKSLALSLTSTIISAHVSNNKTGTSDLPLLIQRVYQVLSNLGSVQAEQEAPHPAVPIRNSIGSDFIVCLEDGRRMKMLKRYLKKVYSMTPDEYRERWGLPPTYPMVAPSYAAKRSELARKCGLGKRGRSKKPEYR